MQTSLFLALILLSTPSFGAEEPSGCDKFKWSIERERALLAEEKAKDKKPQLVEPREPIGRSALNWASLGRSELQLSSANNNLHVPAPFFAYLFPSASMTIYISQT